MTVDIYGHWVPGEGRERLDQALRPKAKPGNPFTLVQGQESSSAKFDRMDRFEIIEEIGSILDWFGQMFGQDSARRTKQKA